jgi:hypothetical protein
MPFSDSTYSCDQRIHADHNHHFRIVHTPDNDGGVDMLQTTGWVGVGDMFSVFISRHEKHVVLEVYAREHEDYGLLASLRVDAGLVSMIRRAE